VGFGCSPTILIDSVDPFGDEAAPVVDAYRWSAGTGAGVTLCMAAISASALLNSREWICA